MSTNSENIISNIFFTTIRNSSLRFSEEELNLMIEYIILNNNYCTGCLVSSDVCKKFKLNQKIKLLKHSDIDKLINARYFEHCSKMELQYSLNNFETGICNKIILSINNQEQLNRISIKYKEKFANVIVLSKLK